MTRPRIAICGWIGSTNLGDELIATAVADLVVEAGGEPTLVTIDTDRTAALGYPTIRHAGAMDTIGLVRELRRHDGLLFGGGGLIQDETGPLNIPFHLTRLASARVLRRPWAPIALGVGEVRRRSGRLLCRAVLRGAVAASVRDGASANRYESLTGPRPELGIDPVLALPPVYAEPTEHLVVSLRPPNRRHQRSLAGSTGPDGELLDRWASAIDSIAASRGLDVRMVTWDRGHDEAVHTAVAARLTAASEIEHPDASTVIERMGSGRLILTMRYHGMVAAALTGRPAVALDYSPKMADLAAESRGGFAVVKPDVDPSEIVAAADLVANETAAGVTETSERAGVNKSVVARLVEAASRR